MKLVSSTLILAVFISARILTAQQIDWTLTGTVVDKSDYDPIPNVNIYISSTTIGTTSDERGRFSITGIPFETVTVVFSCIGFEAETKQVIFKDNKTIKLTIKMNEITYDLPSIDVVETENEEWQRNYRLFKKVLLGEPEEDNGSEINNPYRINFSSSFDGTLTASCPEPLIIMNEFLGYKLTYNLEEFIYSNPKVRFFGTVYFEENLSKDPGTAEKQKKNRLVTYFGSMRHLLKTISKIFKESYRNTQIDSLDEEVKFERNIEALAKEGFTVSTVNKLPEKLNKPSTAFPVNSDKLIKPGISGNELVLKFKNFLRVDFDPGLIDPAYSIESDIQHSWITLDNREAYIDLTSWSIDEYTIKTYGDWANKRVLDMLPLDYKPQSVQGAINEIY